MNAFPVDPYLDAIAEALQNSAFVLLKAEPGAGKTTRVPLSLLAHYKKILVVQPRRLAARLAASWVAQESGQALGELVGYQIRLDHKASSATRLLFVTEGVLTRKLLQDRRLREFDLVILDEFHERHIHTDLALAMLRQLSEERPNLRVLVMSATLDLSQLLAYLGEVPSFDVPGRSFPVALEYRPPSGGIGLEEQIATAVQAMLGDPRCGGNILVFLSGLSEINSCLERLARTYGSDLELIPLTAELAMNYERLYQAPERVKVILSTNVAETSVTLPHIKGVIDSGWAKISGFASWSGLPTLEKQRISQASCIQRAGRAGRVAAGVCYRLYSALDFNSRPLFTEPEIRRIDLCQTMLEIQAIYPEKAMAWQDLPWFERPDQLPMENCRELLSRLGAINAEGFLTSEGRRMAELPLHPRLARLVFAGNSEGYGGICLLAALLINEGMLLGRGEAPREHGHCDVSYQLQLLIEGKGIGRFFDRNKAQRIRQLYESLRRALRFVPFAELKRDFDEQGIRQAIFLAFADRVAKYRPLAERGPRAQRYYNFCQGRGGVLSDSSVVREAEWVVAVEARENLSDDSGQRCRIELVSAVDPLWLETDPFQLLSQNLEVSLDEKSGRARKLNQLWYGKLLLKENIEQAASGELHDVLFLTLKERWPEPFSDLIPLQAFHGKLRVLSRHGITHKLPHFSGEYLDLLQAYLCEGARSLSEISHKDLRQAIEEQLDYADLVHLTELCPDLIKLSNGRQLKVHYEDEGEPWIEAKIQEFFGQLETPRICLDRQPLLIKLLAPNRRPAQITQDLRGFWQGSYHDVKKELKRRYPKHAWPDEPSTYKAEPKEARPRS